MSAHKTSSDTLFFQKISEGRTNYFVEYRPPHEGYPFSMLSLTYPGSPKGLPEVAEDMEREALHWHSRFAFPVMTSAFDKTGSLICLRPVRASDHLFAYQEPSSRHVERVWRLVRKEELPPEALDRAYVLRVFKDVPSRTKRELRLEAQRRGKAMRILSLAVVGWLALAPIAWLIIEYLGPAWFAALLFGIGLWRGVINALKLFGRLKKSRRELATEAEERRRNHYFYHCERNPEAFEKLKLQNFEREAEEEIQSEARQLNSHSKRSGGGEGTEC